MVPCLTGNRGGMKPGPPYGGKKNGACFIFSEHGEDAFSCSLTSHPATDVEVPETNPDLMPFQSSSMPSLSRTELLLPQILYPTGIYASDAPLLSTELQNPLFQQRRH
uniref:Uncharacterized protein n=1 Tax=Micrurus corallinus TaxID=54390 RepID=A0A2D4GFF9_MICCO